MQHITKMALLETLIERICDNPSLLPDRPSSVRLIETHISYVLLTGTNAYKFKKPCNLGFLDFRDINDRRKYCCREFQMNSTFSPDIYLSVLRISGNLENPIFEEFKCDSNFEKQSCRDVSNMEGGIVEYAVRMKQFDTEQQLDRLLEKGLLSFEIIEELASVVAEAHKLSTPSSYNDESLCKFVLF